MTTNYSKKPQPGKDDYLPMLSGSFFYVKKSKGHYVLKDNNGNTYTTMKNSRGGKRQIPLRCKSLEELGMEIGEMRAKLTINSGIIFSEGSNFTEEELRAFDKGYVKGYTRVKLEDVVFSRTNSGVYRKPQKEVPRNDNLARL